MSTENPNVSEAAAPVGAEQNAAPRPEESLAAQATLEAAAEDLRRNAPAASAARAGEASLSSLYDLTLPVSIELGRTHLTVQEVLHLGRGSVIELDRLAGEPVDVFVGDRRFAEGEVVVLGENFGLRITRIISTGAEAA